MYMQDYKSTISKTMMDSSLYARNILFSSLFNLVYSAQPLSSLSKY